MNSRTILLLIFFFLSFSYSYAQQKSNYSSNENNDQVKFSPAISVNGEEDNHLFAQISNSINEAYSNSKARARVSEAVFFYKKSINAFKLGDFKEAKKYFAFFINRIESAEIDPRIYFFLFDDLENILTKLKTIYNVENALFFPSSGNYSIPMATKDNSLIEKYIAIYSSGKAKYRVQEALERAASYKDIVLNALSEFNLPSELFYLPIVESLYDLRIVSSAGAAGIWQIMPHRGRALGLHINYWIDERRDPEKSTKAACLYLKQLYIMLNDWHLVLAAYNRGEYGLIRDMKFSNASDISEMVSRNAIPKETQNYVPQFIAAVQIGDNLEKYNFKNLRYLNPLKYDKYKTNEVIDLKIVAQCAETSLDEIKTLNPALNAWCTPHGYPGFELKIPYGSKEKLIENIKNVKDLNPSPGFVKHKVLKGEYLEKIATKYKTSIKEIKKDNPFISKQKYLKPGQVIVVRPGRNYFK